MARLTGSKNLKPRSDKGTNRVQFCPKGHDTFVTGRYDGSCIICIKERAIEWSNSTKGKEYHKKYDKEKAKSPSEIARQRNKKWRGYGIKNLDGSPFIVKDYEIAYKNQNGKCAICGTTDPKGQGNFHVDHNHVTCYFRGLLCSSCNIILGFVEKYSTDKRFLNYLKVRF